MLSKYKLTNMLIIVSTILGSSQVHRSTTMAFPSDSDSDSSEAPSPIVSNTDTETKNPEVAGSGKPVTGSNKPAPSATASPSGERPSIATILEKAGFKVFSMSMFSKTSNNTIDNEQVFVSLVKHVSILLNEYVSLIENILSVVTQIIEMLRQGIRPMTEDGKYEINREPLIIRELHVGFASMKLRSYSLKTHKTASLNIANETWDKLFSKINGIKKFIKTNESKAGGVDIIMEPFEPNKRSEKKLYTIARILVSIDLIDSIVPRLYEEYQKRLKDSSCTVKLVGKNPDRELRLSVAREVVRDTTDEAIEAKINRIEVGSQCEGRGSLSPHYKLLISNTSKDFRDRAKIVLEDLENTTVRLNDAEYLEYLLYCEVRLKGLMEALVSIGEDVNDLLYLD
ncbi:hypothetical protein PAEPH01_2038 [Pancytospora epiphaga]|nr:hypothetical protein PAEPH01_2038 [Pancytospora epiphaga]